MNLNELQIKDEAYGVTGRSLWGIFDKCTEKQSLSRISHTPIAGQHVIYAFYGIAWRVGGIVFVHGAKNFISMLRPILYLRAAPITW